MVSRYTIELQLSHRVKDHTFNVYCTVTDHDVNNMDASELLERLSMTQYYYLKIVTNFNTIHSNLENIQINPTTILEFLLLQSFIFHFNEQKGRFKKLKLYVTILAFEISSTFEQYNSGVKMMATGSNILRKKDNSIEINSEI